MNEDKREKDSNMNGTEHTSSSDIAKHDIGKPHLSYVPSAVIWAIAYIREYGNAKYHNPYNWHSVEPDRYIEALLRHVELYRENPFGYDEESGLPHLWHIACNVAFLCDFYQDIFNGELGIKNGDPLDFEKVSPYFWKDCKEVDSDLLKKIFQIEEEWVAEHEESENGVRWRRHGEQLETDEAIEWLYDMKHYIKYDEQSEALNMAIEALGEHKEKAVE